MPIDLFLDEAERLDKCGRYSEALQCYQEGLKKLLIGVNKKKEVRFKKWEGTIGSCREKIEILKVQVAKEKGRYFEQIKIPYGSTNNSYKHLMGKCLDEFVTSITVEDPYIRRDYQVENFERFCELSIQNCPNLKNIHLTTNYNYKYRPEERQFQEAEFEKLQKKLNVSLSWKFDLHLHDREIREAFNKKKHGFLMFSTPIIHFDKNLCL